jgi:hypothetical protein
MAVSMAYRESSAAPGVSPSQCRRCAGAPWYLESEIGATPHSVSPFSRLATSPRMRGENACNSAFSSPVYGAIAFGQKLPPPQGGTRISTSEIRGWDVACIPPPEKLRFFDLPAGEVGVSLCLGNLLRDPK